MPKRAIIHEECVEILEDFITEQFTLKDLSKNHEQSLSSISKLVNFKSPYLITSFDPVLTQNVEEIDIRQLGIKIRDSREKKKPEIDYDKIFEEGRVKKRKLQKLLVPLLDVGFKASKLSIYFNMPESTLRKYIREVDPEYFIYQNRSSDITYHDRDSVIKRCNDSHGEGTYGYDRAFFQKSKDKTEIFCFKCDKYFKQAIGPHSLGKGCRNCAQKRNAQVNKLVLEEILERCFNKHGDFYDYSRLTGEFTKDEKVWIGCPIHSWFLQNLGNHMYLGNGCPNCRNSKMESQARVWFDSNGIEFESQKRFNSCRNILPLPFDYYLPEYNIILELNGEQHFRPVEYFGGEKAFKEQQKRDKIKFEWVEESPYTLHYINYNENVESRLREILSL